MSMMRRAQLRLLVMGSLLSLGLTCVRAAEVVDPAARLQDDVRRGQQSMPMPAPAAPAKIPDTVPLPAGPVLQGQIDLQEVLFSPSQLLSQAQLGQLVLPYIGRKVGSDDLNALLRDIQAMYLSLGVTSAVPIVPPQDLKTGVLKVILVEGTLGQVKFAGGSRADAAWLAQWFDMTPGEVIRPEPLARRLDLFNASSDFNAEAQYVAGSTFGASDLEVTVPALPNTQYWAMGELPGVGAGRTLGNSLILGFRHFPASSVGGRVDGMVIQGPTATTMSVTAGLPLGQQGWRLGAGASASRSRTVLESTDPTKSDLLIEGASSSLNLELLRHVFVMPGQLWKLSGSVWQIASQSKAAGATLTDRTVQRLTLAASTDWVVDPASGAERATFRGALNSAKGPVNSFAYAEVFGSLAYRLAGAQGPVLRANGQARLLDSRTPDVSDAWLAGSSASVRGFDPGAVSGRKGQSLQLAIYQTLPWKAVDTPEAFVFADQAHAVKEDIAHRIASAGVGMQFQVHRQWSIETALTHQTQGFQGPRTRALLRASASW
jgi:hemolysin activation/secretion protein